jgi:hypothetical protein
MGRFTPAMLTGVVAGLLFFGHAMINNSQAWPLVWPFVGGAAAVVLAARRHRLQGFWSGLRAGAGSGALSAALFFATTVVALKALNLIPPDRFGAVAALLAVAAGIGFVLATVGGALSYPFARRAERAG